MHSLALLGVIMHISDGFWANLLKSRDAKLPVYGYKLGGDGRGGTLLRSQSYDSGVARSPDCCISAGGYAPLCCYLSFSFFTPGKAVFSISAVTKDS